MRKVLSFVGVPLLSVLFFLARPVLGQESKSSGAYRLMLASMYKNTVPTMAPAALLKLLQKQPSEVLLLDTRTPEEFNVSHLQGARFISYEQVDDEALKALPRTKKVVVYCSVGYRSERIGERLKALGFKNVYNLYGGIFQWVNEGLPVVNARGATQKVHAYSRSWGIWLRKGEKVYE